MIRNIIQKAKSNIYILCALKVIFLLAILVSIDLLIGKTLSYYYFKQESGLLYRTTYSIEKTTADLLIFGSSRANHQYYPTPFENRLKLSYYNVGRDGCYLFYHYAVLKGVMKRYSPKMIILDFLGDELKKNPDSYARISSLLPYDNRHPEMRPIIELKSPFEKFKLLSSIYPYNSLLLTILMGNSERNKKRMADIEGYVPLSNTWNGSILLDNSPLEYEIDSTKLKVYQSFIHDCITSKIKLYIVCSPYLIKSNHTDYSILIGKKIASANHVSFLDYSNDPIFLHNPQWFSDVVHLNNEGAKIFSNRLINKIISSNEETVKSDPVVKATLQPGSK